MGTRRILMGALHRLPLHIVLPTLSGVLTIIGGIYPPLWFAIWFAPAPFFWLLFSASHTSTQKRALLTGLLFGFSLNLTVSTTGWSAYPLDWMGIASPLVSMAIIGIISLGLSLCMGCGYALFSLVVFELRSRGAPTTVLLTALPILWIGTEWLQAIFFSIYMLGPTSTIHAFFQTASIGYVLGNPASGLWISLARWGGLPTLSVFPVLFNSLLALAANTPKRRDITFYLAGATLVLFIFFACSAAAAYSAEHARNTSTAWGDADTLIVVAVTTDFPAQLVPGRDVLAARTDIVFDIVRGIATYDVHPDVVILPEGVGLKLGADEYSRISAELPKGTLLIHSGYEKTLPRSTAQIRAHEIGGTTSVIDKQFMMPYGEYPPYHFLAPLWFVNRTLYHAVRTNREYMGGTTTTLGEANGVPVGVRACSEIFSPQLYRSLAEEGAGLLAQSSSIKIFEGAPLLEWTMRSAARIRAVENGLPIVQSFNGGESRAFDCRGIEIPPFLVADAFHAYRIPRSASCAGK